MKKLFLFIFLFFQSIAFAVDYKIVSVGDATLKKDKLHLLAAKCESSLGKKNLKRRQTTLDILSNDFLFYKHLFELSQDTGEFSLNKLSAFKSKNIAYLLVASCPKNAQSNYYNIKLINIIDQSELFSDDINIAENNKNKLRKATHKIADEIYFKMTGKRSIFTSEITFVSDIGSTRNNRFKELYIMDFDGKNVRRLTNHRRIIMSPSFSPTNNKILYSLIDKQGKGENINLYYFDREKKASRLISRRKGINAGAIYNADGKSVILTLSNKGNAEIYWLDIATKKIRKITSHYSIDVDPSINATGDLMTFLSGRAGSAMIYTLDPRGVEKNVKRISFVGKFNATPRFSPDGKKIVFSSWLDNSFDLFLIDSNGSNLSRLTKNFGSNEEPNFSRDGEFIIFTSQRVLSRYKAVQNIYIMNRFGEVLGALTSHMGSCFSPRFSK